MRRDLKMSYPLYDSVYDTEHPSALLFLHFFGEIPSKLTNTRKSYDPTILEFFKENGFIEESKVFSNSRRFDLVSQILLVNDEKQIFIEVKSSTDTSKNNLCQIDIFYNLKNGELEQQMNLEELVKFERTKKKANILLVKSDMGHLDTEDYDLIVDSMDIELNYGQSFLKAHDVIAQRLNKNNDKGIILLHGDPGTGKTSYIKHLTTLIKDKDILFIPPSMAEMLSEPSIIPFLMDHKNSILIIEDAERVIADREGNGSSAGVSNILNLTDGILGDCLSIQIIATFNMKREKIDQALLRKGRLIAEHKFENLSVDETNKLLKHIEKDFTSTEPMCLADIYNIDVEIFRTSNKSKIGFNN
jgi:energy-coupling factor transporter ATP-binding protein EcfA2